jgi:hypothetical protein
VDRTDPCADLWMLITVVFSLLIAVGAVGLLG